VLVSELLLFNFPSAGSSLTNQFTFDLDFFLEVLVIFFDHFAAILLFHIPLTLFKSILVVVVTLILGKRLEVCPLVVLGCTARTIRGLVEVTTILSELVVVVVAALHLTSVTRATVDWGLKVHHHIRVVMDFLVYRVLDI
jgi:hypothetical protein